MKNQFNILQSFYRYNSEKMPHLDINKQRGIIKSTPSQKTIVNIFAPFTKNIFKKSLGINDKDEYMAFLEKRRNHIIEEGVYVFLLINIYLKEKGNFLNLNKTAVFEKYINVEYIRNILFKKLFILNDIIHDLDEVKRHGISSYYFHIIRNMETIFSDNDSILFYYNMFLEHDSFISKLGNSGIFGYLISSYMSFYELGHQAGYHTNQEYDTTTLSYGEKIKWLFSSWDNFIRSLSFGGVLCKNLGIYEDVIPLNRMLYNIKTILQYNPELLGYANIFVTNNINRNIKFVEDLLVDMEITKTNETLFFTFYDTYLGTLNKASYYQFSHVIKPLLKQLGLTNYFINNFKNTTIIYPKNPFEEEIDPMFVPYPSEFAQGEYPLFWTSNTLVSNFGFWIQKRKGLNKKATFIEGNSIKNIKLIMNNNFTLSLKYKNTELLRFIAIPEQFNMSIEEYYLLEKKKINQILFLDQERFSEFFKELYKQTSQP